ncbi:MAG: hypothetical protein KAG20_09180 [Cocleimonas sp.]|nr:hypothetical protein [Cocleimonas sp.]
MSIVQWSHKFTESYTIYIILKTKKGRRYIYYRPTNEDEKSSRGYVRRGLGEDSRDGQWHTFTRDLDYELKINQPDNEIINVLGFKVRGSGRLDDIKLLNSPPADLDSDVDGLTDLDEMNTHGTSPYHADSDNDAIEDGAELRYWNDQVGVNNDVDKDGIINILDRDSDNDGYFDGFEIAQSFDPADARSTPLFAVIEDAENGETKGWRIYDNKPLGATIRNVYDADKGSQVIELKGRRTSNGYRLRSSDDSWWHNDQQKIIHWSHKFGEYYSIYVAVNTKNGFRYIQYRPIADNKTSKSKRYVYRGLGTASRNGQWQTFTRDLSQDLKKSQPDNELIEVLGVLVRGSGRMDDIHLLTK